MEAKSKTLSGTVESVIFYNQENSFTVLNFVSDNDKTSIIAVGEIPNIHEGLHLKISGNWTKHKKYGKQFTIESFEASHPKGNNALEKYLSSNLIDGIGPKYARKIVNCFGDKTIEIILDEPEKLREVSGIGKKRAKTIAESVRKAYTEQKSLQDLSRFLFGYGFNIGLIKRIWHKYDDKAINIIKRNPYRLAEDVWGIGFATADKIGRAMKLPEDHPERIVAGLFHILSRAKDDGNCFLTRELLVPRTEELLDIDRKDVEQSLDKATSDECIIQENDRIYPPNLYAAEVQSAEILSHLLAAKPSKHFSLPIAESYLNEIQKNTRINYTAEQRKAIIQAITSKVVVITGGPGTGKTTIVKGILRIAQKLKLRVDLAAPTGRAAKRLEETTSHRARTIHRLLHFNPGLRTFEYNRQNALKIDMLVVDEVSMVDILLFRNLLSAIPYQGRLVLVGDSNQLPSVGPGAVLRDLINSESMPVVRLNRIMRQSKHSLIVRNAHRVLKGNIPVVNNHTDDDFFISYRDDSDKARQTVIDLVTKRIPRAYGYDPVKDIQVITPMHKGRCGAKSLNAFLRESLNKNHLNLGLPFSVGDKVMQIANNYDLDVFNGDIGIVSGIIDRDKIAVRFDGRDVVYESDIYGQLTLAYAVTIHKSQGSEYPVVVLPIMTEHYVLLARNLLYTAITRAEKLLVIVGSRKAIIVAVNNSKPMKRSTMLANRLRELIRKQRSNPI